MVSSSYFVFGCVVVLALTFESNGAAILKNLSDQRGDCKVVLNTYVCTCKRGYGYNATMNSERLIRNNGTPCVACVQGQTFNNDAASVLPCDNLNNCRAGPSFVSKLPTLTSDRRCDKCPANSYSTTKNALACIPTFNDGSISSIPALCNPGTYLAIAGCTPCPAGKFTTEINENNCRSFTVCEKGKFVSAQGTASSDRACSPCPPGQTSKAENSPSCS